MELKTNKPHWQPLEVITLAGVSGGGTLSILDGAGVEYVRIPAMPEVRFTVGGALGTHTVLHLDNDNRFLESLSFRVDTATRIADGSGKYARLLQLLYLTMVNSLAERRLVDGKVYHYFVCWLRDHTHTMKGMKYFDGDLKTGLELYADTQRADGMVYDRIASKPDVQGWRDHSFKPGDFVRTVNPGTSQSATLQRIPVENDVEYLFIECLYFTWKATGDTGWMARYLDNAIRAVKYATTDPYRWSKRFQLLKRGYTIDTWDFMHDDDVSLTTGDNVVDIDKTTFGVMHGDNTGMAASCRYLAEMLESAGRSGEAPAYRKLSDELTARLNDLAWSGTHYRHHVSEDPSFARDLGGTDEAAQVSLSNAYALNRGIGTDKCQTLLQTYQRIREEMPANSPGEFYLIYPPFEHGFDKQDVKWQYMNGGVSTIVAGELARGAFENGQEKYGTDILDRLLGLAERHGGHLHVCFNGNPQTEPPCPRTFSPADLSSASQVTAAWRPEGGWGDSGNDLSRMPIGKQEFCGVPFTLDASKQGLGLAAKKPGFSKEVRLPVGKRHASLYLLHTIDSKGSFTGEMVVRYADGETVCKVIQAGEQLEDWFMPGSKEIRGREVHEKKLPKGWPPYQLAWRGANDSFENVGLFVWGWDNPRPETEISEIVFRTASTGGAWFIPAMTWCDQPVWFRQSELSFGIPDCWGAGAVVYALIEGLAGVVDNGLAFSRTTVTPRWEISGETCADVTVHYPASGGYAAYRWKKTDSGQRITLTSCADEIMLRLLLLDNQTVKEITVNGTPVKATIETVGERRYAVVPCLGHGVFDVILACL
ncbi:MAG: hypothetical protein HOO88_09700 [Kiritimatiellaceae bacterium]|nr:hypothetical protein [Kiritimatiellaceae bacterium]